MRSQFYFNTGVKQSFNPNLAEGQVFRGGVKQIPFECENVPEGAEFSFACNTPDLPEANHMIVREIVSGTMVSKYAYFTKPYNA